MAVENVGMDVSIKFIGSRSNGFRDIREAHFVSNERTNMAKLIPIAQNATKAFRLKILSPGVVECINWVKMRHKFLNRWSRIKIHELILPINYHVTWTLSDGRHSCDRLQLVRLSRVFTRFAGLATRLSTTSSTSLLTMPRLHGHGLLSSILWAKEQKCLICYKSENEALKSPFLKM